MSMTQVAFLKKADIPTKTEIEKNIRDRGYEFEILDDFENFHGINGIECLINGHKTFFEIYFNEPSEITNECEWIKADLTDQDTAISFIWGADFGAGACIGLISIVLIDKSNALSYYLDDEMKYSQEMLIDDTPKFLAELEKQNKIEQQNISETKTEKPNKKGGFWALIKKLFR